MRRTTRPLASPRQAQRGGVAIVVGVSLVVMVGFVGLALDGGHLYVTKTELQNAADGCALAAAYELAGAPSIPPEAFTRADAAGKAVAQKNKVDFQGGPIASADVTLEFGASLGGGGWLSAGAAPGGSAKYARCTIQRTGIAPWFMQVMGFGPQSVAALATATLSPAQTSCGLPMGLCVRPSGAAPDYGYVIGNWYGMDFQDTGGPANYTGNFRWIDYDPSAPTPGCPGGGASELACIMAGTGQCSLPAPITGSCSSGGSSKPTPGCVGQSGAISSMEAAYNTRFGLYKGSYSLTTSPPDFTGYGYSTENWTLGRDAYSGSGGVSNFRDARTAHTPASNVAGVNPAFYKNSYNPSSSAQHASDGADRRLVILPILDCSSFTGSQHAPIRAYACVLMLDPYRKDSGNNVVSRLEYRGRSNMPGSPCASSGIAGDVTSEGPLVPSLVQ
jgi:hypothetical protein